MSVVASPSNRSAGAVPVPKSHTDYFGTPDAGWRQRLHTVVFRSDTPAGLWFDKVLIVLIVASVLVVMMESMEALPAWLHQTLAVAELVFTGIFTLEYLARLLCVRRPWRYARSFFGIIDLLSILPTYLALLVPGLHVLIDVRVLRLIRVFRIFKLTAFVMEYQTLGGALAASWRKIMVFLSVVLMIVLVMGTLMYVIEGPAHGFTNIPTAVYWAITTMTTVGFGDITPKTDLGRLIASLMMLLGWGTLAVPTGIVTAEMSWQRRVHEVPALQTPCPGCGSRDHSLHARYCQHCGSLLDMPAPESVQSATMAPHENHSSSATAGGSRAG
ncbi:MULTISPECIES: ion transporter [Giesbergeria]|uniref:Ion transporter n=1 Tax=Giesbergeria sinuosa TaxID=80883 RepID=A0ABV9QGR2_9BURK